MSTAGPQLPAVPKSGENRPQSVYTEAEPAHVQVPESSDWHDQIKSASRLLAMAMDRLGLEERHENLSKASPFYKKVSSAVFPPFKASLNYIHAQTEPGHAESTGNAEVHEEEDVALLVSEHQGSTSILSMLATASACAGATSLKAIGSILHDRYRDEDEGGSDSEGKPKGPESNSGEKAPVFQPHHSSHEEITQGKEPLSRPTSRSNGRRPSAGSGAPGGSIRKQSVPASLTGGTTDELRLMYSSEIMAKALRNGDYRPPPENLRSPWENSVMANHHVQSSGDHALITYETADDGLSGESPEKTEILKYHIALKLKETFAFEDDNYLYDHFDVWLVKDVLLQGHMYITRDAVCFYSLLPGKFSVKELNDPELTVHSGALGHKLAHYGDAFFSSVYTNRFWAVLKPTTLSIYTSPTKLYFPVRTIDLHSAISCEILEPIGANLQSAQNSPNMGTPTEPSMSQINSELASIASDDAHEENVQAGVWFRVTCTDKQYRFHTSSIYSARHWYNSISKAIFALRNTNAQREVIMRLPIEDIVDYKKNFVLSDAETAESQAVPSPQDDEAPISFSIKFNLPQSTEDSKVQKLKQKTKKIGEAHSLHDSAHFVAFQKGADLSRTFERALEENVLDSAEKNHKLKKRAKKFFRDDRTDSGSLHSKTAYRVVTTVQPEYLSSSSVIDKIVEVNAKISQARVKMEEQANETVDRGNEAEKKFSYVPNFKGMKDRLMPKTSPIAGLANLGDGLLDVFRQEDESLAPSQDFEIPDFDYHLQLPKPFSLQMLKNLDIQMVRKRRSFDDIAGQYGNLSEVIKEKRAKDKAFARRPIAEETEYDVAHDGSESRSEGRMGSPISETRGKLRSLKRSLRTVSTIGGVWSARPEHFDSVIGHDKYFIKSKREKVRALNRFRKHFSLGPDSHLVSTYFAHLKRTMPVYGRLYIGKDQVCFRSMIPGVSTKMVLPLRDIQSCKKQARSYHYAGLLLKIRGLEDLSLAFGSKDSRDDCQKMILKLLRKEDHFNPDSEFIQDNQSDSSMDIDETERQNKRSDELANLRIHAARLRLLEDKVSYATGIEMPLILEDNPFTTIEVKLAKCYRITLLTIGSRGDVQPYIALGKALVKEGHEVTIATHAEFEDWIRKHGIDFKEVAGNPAELMSLMVTHGSISVGFLKEASTKFRGWIGELLESSWKACQGAELLIESPSAMAGLHIAEALNIPYMRAFTMPWTRTRAYPHAFLVPDQNRGGSYNFLTHVMFENVFWKGISGQVNKWRQETLGLPRTSLVKMQQSRVPFLYNVSPALFPPSVDFPDWVKVTGYWFLNEGSDEYEPPKELVDFLEEAKQNGEKVVYIGFGSIVVSDAKALTKTIVEAVLDSGVKCILNKGWSDKLSKSKDDIEVELPSQVYDSGMIPHDWLFTKIDAAVHHGGSGTTGATLRAGLPTIIKPFFGDQFFFASRVEDLGVGIALKNLNKKSFTKALKSITSQEKYAVKATEIAKAMSHERGVLSAVEAIYTELAYSRSLISVIRHNTEQKKSNDDKSGVQTPVIGEEDFDMINGMEDDEANEEQVREEHKGDSKAKKDKADQKRVDGDIEDIKNQIGI
ncbi:hypothetical protein OXX59_005905 [Metschnikowia pulcherrima]